MSITRRDWRVPADQRVEHVCDWILPETTGKREALGFVADRFPGSFTSVSTDLTGMHWVLRVWNITGRHYRPLCLGIPTRAEEAA